jgi:hypothetical protein
MTYMRMQQERWRASPPQTLSMRLPSLHPMPSLCWCVCLALGLLWHSGLLQAHCATSLSRCGASMGAISYHLLLLAHVRAL